MSSASPAAERAGRSALRRLLFGLGAAAALLAAAAVGLAQWLTTREMNAEFARAIAGEVAQLERFKSPRELAVELLARAPRMAGHAYLVELPDGACPLAESNAEELCPAGNLRGWPQGVPRESGPLRFTRDGAPMIAQVVIAESHHLIVAREAAPLDRAIAAAWRAAALTGLGILAGAGLLAWLAARWLLGRLGAMNAACEAVEEGDLARRLPRDGSGDEFDRLAGHVNRMLDRVVELLRVVRHVSEHAAHDLRTPLARLRLGLERAARGTRDAQAREALEDALDRIDSLQQTFTALLAIADNEAGDRSDFAPVDLAAIAAEVVETHLPLAELAEVALELDARPAIMRGSAGLLRTMLGNLLHNAIKHAPPGSAVEIGIGGGVLIRIADRGPGIPPDLRERVFQKFFVGEPGSPRAGTGLGLSLVRVIAHRHGLAITLADNAPGLAVELTPSHASNHAAAPRLRGM